MLDSYRDLLDGLLESPTALRETLGDPLPETIAPGRMALLMEIRAREAAVLRRAQAIVRDAPHGSRPTLRAIEDEPEVKALAAHPASGGESVADLFSGFSHDRSELVSILMNVTIREWEQTIDHHGKGETTLADEIEDHLTWDEDMVARMRGMDG
ncbi:MAG: hypothetical protein QM589_15275 [Thermomicrobiales bacterium]